MNSFEKQFFFGQIGESIIARWVRSRGYDVLPVYEKEIANGKGPRLFLSFDALASELVAPDMLAISGAKTRWVEAKHKSAFSWRRITQRWQDGIDLRHYLDYQKVEQETGWPVWLFFFHAQAVSHPYDRANGAPVQCPTGLFGAPLSWLKEHEDHRGDFSRNGHTYSMVYWNVDMLPRQAMLEELQMYMQSEGDAA
jgi:hypothetical protein